MSVANTPITKTLITYEHPVNEQMRLYLRLEHLFKAYHASRGRMTTEDSKMALISLLQLVNVSDRADLKSKLVQLLTLIRNNLHQLEQSPAIDHSLLDNLLTELGQHLHYYDTHRDKLGHTLRKHEFLNQVRLNLSHPAGPCEVSLHALNLWLQRPQIERNTLLDEWFQPLSQLDKTTSLLLSLIRQSTPYEKLTAKQGYYQLTQDNSLPCELIRVSVPTKLNVFPEISANKHRVMIRFLTPDLLGGGKPKQALKPIEFSLACCRA